jgi:Terminase small subunit
LAAYPTCKSRAAAAAAASRLLRIVKVKEAIDALAAARWKRLAMTGDEAAALVANDARADVRQLFDENSKLLPVRDWPDSIARSVKAIRPGPFGTTIVLNDSLAARRIVLEQTGKLKTAVGGGGDLARLLAGDFADTD